MFGMSTVVSSSKKHWGGGLQISWIRLVSGFGLQSGLRSGFLKRNHFCKETFLARDLLLLIYVR